MKSVPDESLVNLEEELVSKLDLVSAIAHRVYRDGAVIQFDSCGLIYIAIHKGDNWWTSTTIGPKAAKYYYSLSELINDFEDISEFRVFGRGKLLYKRVDDES